MKNGPKSPRVDSRDPRIHVPEYLPTDANIRRPLVAFIQGIVKAVSIFVLVALAGVSFAVGVALAQRWMQ